MNNPLLDNEFLTKLMSHRQREKYARITLLTNDELPIEYIEGRITGGSVNVDGASALRRTCNLTMILANKAEINDFNWTFKRKFKLEIGLKNFVDNSYPEIIWFKQGIFILTSCNMSQSTSNYTITLNGKDKMCLLNGDVGGVFTASTTLSTQEFVDRATNTITDYDVPIKDIIRNIVQYLAGELPENIIINDLDDIGLHVMEYNYADAPLFLFRNQYNEISQATLNQEHQVYLVKDDGSIDPDSVNIENNSFKYVTMSNLIEEGTDFTKIKLSLDQEDKAIYTILRLEDGDLAGYKMTDVTYGGELKAEVGETFVSVLDKIKKRFGVFEYFYNLDGKFVFQKKRTYISTPWSAVEQASKEDQDNVLDIVADSSPKINLTNAQLVTQFSNNPNLSNIKNDFAVWGTYSGATGKDIPIHMRYAIDTKPKYYKAIRSIWTRDIDSQDVGNDDYLYYRSLNVISDVDDEDEGKKYSYFTRAFTTDTSDTENIVVDWREIIYQMALDWRALSENNDDFLFEVAAANPNHYPLGITGYEQYYTDMEGFWRQLYNPYPTDGYDSITAAEATDVWEDEELKNDLCVASYYQPLNIDLLYDSSKTGNDKYLQPYQLTDLYVDQDISIKLADGNSVDKKTFYPFLGSKVCHLDENGKYRYYNGTEWKKTDDPTILNAKSLSEIKDANEDELIVQQKYKNFIDNYLTQNSSGQNSRLWIKKNETKKFEDLDDVCQTIFLGGRETDRACNQYLINWVIRDNYGNYADDQETKDKIEYLQVGRTRDYDPLTHWNKAIFDDPGSLFFWFDFLETEGSDLYKYSVKEIGTRTKAINDSDVKSIYYRDIPQVIFVYSLPERADRQSGYTYIQLPLAYQPLFTESGMGKSAKEKVDELIEDHSYCIETTNITTIPLYHLEPNTRILVKDEMSNINGEYNVTKITVPLTYNGTMSLSATKVIPNIM